MRLDSGSSCGVSWRRRRRGNSNHEDGDEDTDTDVQNSAGAISSPPSSSVVGVQQSQPQPQRIHTRRNSKSALTCTSTSTPPPRTTPNLTPNRSLLLHLTLLLLLCLLTPPASASTSCKNQTAEGPYKDLIWLESPMWDLRVRLCNEAAGGGDCVNQAGITCILVSPPTFIGGVYFQMKRSGQGWKVDGQAGKLAFPGCLNATRIIIGECLYDKNRMGGSVQLEVERYDIVMLNKSEVAPDETGRRDDPKYKPTAIQSSTSTTLTTAPPSSTPSANPNSASPPGTSSSTGPNTGLIAVAVCTPVITIALVLIFWLLYRRRKHTRAHPHPPPPPPMASSSTFRVKPSAPSPAELITESQSRDVGRHVFGDPPQQVPLLMHVGGKLYSPEELGANEGTGAELHGRSMAGYEMEGERAVQEMGDHDGHGGAGGWWKRMSRSQSKRDRF